MLNQLETTDVAIIGAGPVGLFAVFACGMQGFKTHVFDSLDQIGGQCSALYPEKPIYDIPASPAILAADLIEKLELQNAPFNPTIHLGSEVNEISGAFGNFIIKNNKGVVVSAKAVIIAAGAGAFGPNRPPIDNIHEFEGKSVFYAVRNRNNFAGKNIVIAGGGDSAIDWANSLAEIANKITIIHRRDNFRAAAASLEMLKKHIAGGCIELATPCQLSALNGKNGILESVEISDMDGNLRQIPADVLLPFFGLSNNLGAIANWGLGIDKHHIMVEAGTQKTNINGIYAIGDIAQYPHKLHLILTGFADAANAAHAIHRQIFPDKEIHQEYSTTKGVKGLVG